MYVLCDFIWKNDVLKFYKKRIIIIFETRITKLPNREVTAFFMLNFKI